MKNVVVYLLFIGLMVAGYSSRAQYDPLYNQYTFDQLLINPAYAGVHDVFAVNLLARQQWVDIEGAPTTISLSAHTSIAKNSGIGIMLINERFGVSNNLEFYGSYAYHINFGRGKLSLGVSGGMLSYKYDYSKLNLEFLDDPQFQPLDESISQANFGTGIWYQAEKYYIGFSIPRILEVEVEKDDGPSNRYRRHIYVGAGGLATLSPALKLKPYALMRIANGLAPNFDLGLNLLIQETIWAGVMVRDFDAVAIMSQIEINDAFRVGISAEIATTKLVETSYGTYEIMLGFNFAAFGDQVLKRRYF